MLRPVRTAAPAVDLVTTDEAKENLRILHNDHDARISALRDAAVAHLDGYEGILGRCLVTQTWRQDFTGWPVGLMRLPFPDVQAISSIVYSDTAEAEQTVSNTLYELLADELGSYVRFRDAFTSPALYSDRSDPVRVTFTVGYGDAASDVPAALVHAAHVLISHWYKNRETLGDPNIGRLISRSVIEGFDAMTAITITASAVAWASGSIIKGAKAGEAFDAGDLVYLSASNTYLKAQSDGTAIEAGQNGLFMALATAEAAGARVSLARPGAIVTVGSVVTPGEVYFPGATAGDLVPLADRVNASKITPAALGISATQLLLMWAYNAGSVFAT